MIGINHEEPFFVFLGVLCGLLGTLFIYFAKHLNEWRARNAKKGKFLFKNNWVYSLVVCFFINIVMYFTKVCQSDNSAVLNALIDIDSFIDLVQT